MKNKSQSQIISTVLLVLLSIATIVIISGVVITFVKDKLNAGNCIDVVGKIEILENSVYTCYDSANQIMRVQVHISDIANKTKGFSVELGGAESKAYKITNEEHDDVIAYSNSSSFLPKNNEARTYNITNVASKPSSAQVYPILTKGEICSSSEILEVIETCL
jgi:hypothetical protein